MDKTHRGRIVPAPRARFHNAGPVTAGENCILGIDVTITGGSYNFRVVRRVYGTLRARNLMRAQGNERREQTRIILISHDATSTWQYSNLRVGRYGYSRTSRQEASRENADIVVPKSA